MKKAQGAETACDLGLCRERVRGIEPPFRAWEARVLPLNYTRGRPGMIGAAPSSRNLARPRHLPPTEGVFTPPAAQLFGHACR
jgi:hypothetical protein